MNNYDFCIQWLLDHLPGEQTRVLDYGCGAGQIVAELRRRGIDSYGCDIFYEASDYAAAVDRSLFGTAIKPMEGGIIPFENASFDLIVNNQVMEHVEDLDVVLAEIKRVLKPGGIVINLFPHKGVWREGHCGVPFLHWFPKGSRARVYYAAALRSLGAGYHKRDVGIVRWSEDTCAWLDKWTHYRTRKEIHTTYNHYFCDIRHIEDDWLQARLGQHKTVATWLPAITQKFVVTRMCGLIFLARKPV